jgi:hypothetical protein
MGERTSQGHESRSPGGQNAICGGWTLPNGGASATHWAHSRRCREPGRQGAVRSRALARDARRRLAGALSAADPGGSGRERPRVAGGARRRSTRPRTKRALSLSASAAGGEASPARVHTRASERTRTADPFITRLYRRAAGYPPVCRLFTRERRSESRWRSVSIPHSGFYLPSARPTPMRRRPPSPDHDRSAKALRTSRRTCEDRVGTPNRSVRLDRQCASVRRRDRLRRRAAGQMSGGGDPSPRRRWRRSSGGGPWPARYRSCERSGRALRRGFGT